MLINILFCDGANYEASLKRRRLAALGLLCVGLVGLVCYFVFVPGSTLPDFAQGFYLGASVGLVSGALVLLARGRYLMRNTQARRRARIRETDERQVQITHTALRSAGYITFFASAAALFVVLPLSMEAFLALAGVMALYVFVFLGASLWLSRKL